MPRYPCGNPDSRIQIPLSCEIHTISPYDTYNSRTSPPPITTSILGKSKRLRSSVPPSLLHPSLLHPSPLHPPHIRILLPRAGGIALGSLQHPSREVKRTLEPRPSRCGQILARLFPSPLTTHHSPLTTSIQGSAPHHLAATQQANNKPRSAGLAVICSALLPPRLHPPPHRHRCLISDCAYCGFPSARHRLHPS